MQKIEKLYRSTYSGENVITNMTYEGGTWNFERESIANSVVNNQISNKAIVIGNGVSRTGFNLNLIKNHKGGLLASGALQSYGCNALYREFTPNFLVAGGEESLINEIAESGYADEHIVYANANAIIDHPTKYYLIPQDPSWNTGAVATYLACFDGHKTVYLMGFDGVDTVSASYNLYEGTNGYPAPSYGYSEDFWIQSMMQVFNTYSDVDFVRVMPTEHFRVPEPWLYVPNFRQIDFRAFALEVDL
jgi:hypothetical protein